MFRTFPAKRFVLMVPFLFQQLSLMCSTGFSVGFSIPTRVSLKKGLCVEGLNLIHLSKKK